MPAQDSKPPFNLDSHIEGRFIWHTGYLFFKPDLGEMNKMPLVVPNDVSSNDIGLSSGNMYCLPPDPKFRPGLPEELYDGYEMLTFLPVESLTVPCGPRFIEHLVRTLTDSVLYRLEKDFELKRRPEQEAPQSESREQHADCFSQP